MNNSKDEPTRRRTRSKLVESDRVNGAERSSDGKFRKGNKAGARRSRNRDAISDAYRRAVTPADLRDVVAVVLAKAKGGSLTACRELLDRCIGRPRMQPTSAVVDLGDLQRDGLRAAGIRLVEAASSGSLALEDADRLARIIALGVDLERFEVLEQGLVDLRQQLDREGHHWN